MKRFYLVPVTIKLEMPVVADSPQEAEDIAREYVREEVENLSFIEDFADTGRPREIKELDKVPKDYLGCSCYSFAEGSRGPTPEEFFKEQGEADA